MAAGRNRSKPWSIPCDPRASPRPREGIRLPGKVSPPTEQVPRFSKLTRACYTLLTCHSLVSIWQHLSPRLCTLSRTVEATLEWILWALDAIAQLEQPTDVAALEPGLFKGSVRRVHEASPAQLVVQRNRNGNRAVCGPLLHHHVTAPLPYSLKPVLPKIRHAS
jgi:hypothetical protein